MAIEVLQQPARAERIRSVRQPPAADAGLRLPRAIALAMLLAVPFWVGVLIWMLR